MSSSSNSTPHRDSHRKRIINLSSRFVGFEKKIEFDATVKAEHLEWEDDKDDWRGFGNRKNREEGEIERVDNHQQEVIDITSLTSRSPTKPSYSPHTSFISSIMSFKPTKPSNPTPTNRSRQRSTSSSVARRDEPEDLSSELKDLQRIQRKVMARNVPSYTSHMSRSSSNHVSSRESKSPSEVGSHHEYETDLIVQDSEEEDPPSNLLFSFDIHGRRLLTEETDKLRKMDALGMFLFSLSFGFLLWSFGERK